MSVSSLIDLLNTTIPTITGFSTKKKLTNPYILERNNSKVLSNGWGLSIGESEIEMGSFDRTRSNQSITITLTKSIGGNDLTNSYIETGVKGLSTDLENLKTHLTSNTFYNYSSNIVDVQAESTVGFEYIEDDEQQRYITNSITFIVVVFEDLS